MNSRILPPEEWPRLKGTEAEAVWPQLVPENTRVLVVEEDGEIVGAWVLLRVVHAECLWAAPSHRGSLGVATRLLRGMWEIASKWGASRVVTGSTSPEVTGLIKRVGGEPMPCESFVLPVANPYSRADRERGREFHRQLSAFVTEDHPDDEQHDEQVGRALRTAIEDRAPERATENYNAWARGAGYEPVRFLGSVDGRMRADIVTAVIEVDDQYAVRVVEEATCRS